METWGANRVNSWCAQIGPGGRPSLGPVSPGRTPSRRGSRRCRLVSSTWANGAGFNADTGLRGRTSKRGIGWVNAWTLNSGLRGRPVGTAPYALGANGLRPFLKASAPPAVKTPILIRSRRETCPCDHAFRISARFLQAFSASLTRALDAFVGRYIRVSPCRSNWARLLVDEFIALGRAEPSPLTLNALGRRVMNLELVHEVGPMRLGGLDPDAEDVGDLLRGLAFGHELQDLALARGEMVDRRGRSAQVGIDDGLPHAGTEIDRACLHVADR